MRTKDLKLYIENGGANAVEIDFRNVKFATRGFMDEYIQISPNHLTLNPIAPNRYAFLSTNCA